MISCDNLRIVTYHMTHLSKKLYHYGYAYKHQFDEDVLIRNLDLAYIDAMRNRVGKNLACGRYAVTYWQDIYHWLWNRHYYWSLLFKEPVTTNQIKQFLSTRRRKMKVLFISILLASALFGNTLFAQEPVREVSKVTGDVYRFVNNNHRSVFIVTTDGVVVTDPINAEAASWLITEIKKVTDQPITHLVYSHSHGDHASGGSVFGEVSNIFAQLNAPETIDGVEPTVLFGQYMEFRLGGKTFELTYLGPGHGTDLTAVVIRPENVAFVVDAVAANRLFYRDFPGTNVDGWTNQVRKVETLDFEILVGGHGPVGNKSDVTAGRVYLEELRAAVLAGLKAGKSEDELAHSITMDKYRDWIAYDEWRELNVRGTARYLKESGYDE